MVVIISNTSPIILLARVDALNLVLKVFNIDKFSITQEAFDEIKDANTRGKTLKLIDEGKLEVLPKATDNAALHKIAYEVALANPKPDPKTWRIEQHLGEASVILSGEKNKVEFVLMDDIGGRQIANKRGLKCLHHFDIIKQAVKKSILSKKDAYSHLCALEKEYKYENAEYYKELWSNG